MADLDAAAVEHVVAFDAAVASHLPTPGFRQPAVTAPDTLL